jgi:vacuolar iron transporter family protein
VALGLTGWVSARLGYGSAGRAVTRNVGGGVLAMAVTYGIGALLGTQIG